EQVSKMVDVAPSGCGCGSDCGCGPDSDAAETVAAGEAGGAAGPCCACRSSGGSGTSSETSTGGPTGRPARCQPRYQRYRSQPASATPPAAVSQYFSWSRLVWIWCAKT